MIIQSKKQTFEPVTITFETAKEFYDFMKDLKKAYGEQEFTTTTYGLYVQLEKI